jgi:hypothetical protein
MTRAIGRWDDQVAADCLKWTRRVPYHPRTHSCMQTAAVGQTFGVAVREALGETGVGHFRR